MANSRLKLEDDSIQVIFPAIANKDQQHTLTVLINERIGISKAFGTREKQTVTFSSSTTDDLLQHVKFDLPYSNQFLERNGHLEQKRKPSY
jgi:hypothetical protein